MSDVFNDIKLIAMAMDALCDLEKVLTVSNCDSVYIFSSSNVVRRATVSVLMSLDSAVSGLSSESREYLNYSPADSLQSPDPEKPFCDNYNYQELWDVIVVPRRKIMSDLIGLLQVLYKAVPVDKIHYI